MLQDHHTDSRSLSRRSVESDITHQAPIMINKDYTDLIMSRLRNPSKTNATVSQHNVVLFRCRFISANKAFLIKLLILNAEVPVVYSVVKCIELFYILLVLEHIPYAPYAQTCSNSSEDRREAQHVRIVASE